MEVEAHRKRTSIPLKSMQREKAGGGLVLHHQPAKDRIPFSLPAMASCVSLSGGRVGRTSVCSYQMKEGLKNKWYCINTQTVLGPELCPTGPVTVMTKGQRPGCSHSQVSPHSPWAPGEVQPDRLMCSSITGGARKWAPRGAVSVSRQGPQGPQHSGTQQSCLAQLNLHLWGGACEELPTNSVSSLQVHEVATVT